MIHLFINKIKHLVPKHVTCKQLLELYHTGTYQSCSYIIQIGKHKGQICGKHHCKIHQGIVQCSKVTNDIQCLRSCDKDEVICPFHKKEEQMNIEIMKPVISIRIHESGHFVLRGTNFVMDIIRNGIRGTIVLHNQEWVIDKDESDEIKNVCNEYQLSFIKE